jgi:uncharacterized delta-60 repeat protein
VSKQSALGAVACAVVALAGSAGATPSARGGELDPSFGSGGLVTTDLTDDADSACCIAMQPDGRIVVAGYEASVEGAAGHAFVARYLSDGTLDSSFGGGVVRPRFAADADLVQAIAIQPDGKVVAAGSVVAPDTNIALARWNADGSLDPTFGAGGKIVFGFAPSSRERALALQIATDGKLIVGGAARGGGLPAGNFLVARLNADGSLDATFGSGGKTITDFGALGEVHGLAIDAGGRIVAVGGTFSINGGATWGKAFIAARYNADGSLDTSFGGGKVSTGFAGDLYGAAANDVVVQSDGKVVSVGWIGRGNSRATVVRHNADGTLDSGFGQGGTVVLDEPAGGSGLGGIALDSRGRIVVAGDAAGASLDFELARLRTDGRLDPRFGTGGRVVTNFGGGSHDAGSDVSLAPGGKAVVVGAAGAKVALARYLATSCGVPSVQRKTLAAARTAITQAGCRLGRVSRAYSPRIPAGRVVGQSPRAGAQRPEDSAVNVVVSRGRRR